MGALTILKRCRDAQAEMEAIRRRIERRREAMTGITLDPSQGGSPSGHAGDRYAGFVGAIDEYETMLSRREECRTAERVASCMLLELLPETESAVLYAYYVDGEKVSSIARDMNFSENYVRRIKADGEKRLDKMSQDIVVAVLPQWYSDMEAWGKGAQTAAAQRTG